ncbi:MAG TPA: tetratricopeptide repeat protein [Cyclobacteriaceae bacterium]
MSKRNINVNPQPKKQVEELSHESLVDKANLIYLSVILAIALLVLWRITRNGFTDWDDNLYVVDSPLIRQLNWNSFKTYFTTLTSNLYTPLVTLSYAIDYKIFGMSAAGFHTTNLVLHIINICLVYILTFQIFKRSFIAAATALLFSIHPLNVEAVAWISSRKDLLFTFFYLSGILLYLKYKASQKVTQLLFVFLIFVLAVLSKPVAFTFPVVLLLIDYFTNKTISTRELLEKIPFLFISILVALLGVYLVKELQVFSAAPSGYTFFDKVCLAGFSLAFYLYNGIVPADISNYHEYPFKEGAMLSAKYMMAPVICLLIVFIVIKNIRTNFKLIAGLLMFLIIIGPTLRLIPTGYPVTADRYFYLASVGFFWTMVLVLERVSTYSFALRYIVITVSGILLIIYGVVSFRRVADWKDSEKLWNSVLKNNPSHEVANDHLGKLYDNAGDKDRALIHFQRVLIRNKDNYDVLNSAGNILAAKNETATAIQYFDQAIATGKADHLPYYNRGLVYSSQKQFKKAIQDFDNAISKKPDFAEAFNNRAIAEVQSGDTLKAYRDFSEAVRLKPSDKMMQDNLTRIKSYIH